MELNKMAVIRNKEEKGQHLLVLTIILALFFRTSRNSKQKRRASFEKCDLHDYIRSRQVYVFCFFEGYTLHRLRFWVESINFQRVHHGRT
jgi:hypothetical protein